MSRNRKYPIAQWYKIAAGGSVGIQDKVSLSIIKPMLPNVARFTGPDYLFYTYYHVYLVLALHCEMQLYVIW